MYECRLNNPLSISSNAKAYCRKHQHEPDGDDNDDESTFGRGSLRPIPGNLPTGWGHSDRYPYKLSCRQGKRKLRWNGYHSIVPVDCHGKRYRYRVVRNHKIFKIRMNAFTGRYRKQFIGYVF